MNTKMAIGKYDFAILGGGFQGLFLAYELSKKHKVVLIEKDKQLGGLLSSVNIKTNIEKYYHQLFLRDKELRLLLTELNLDNKLVWIPVNSGFYFKGKIYKFVRPIDLLSFKPLTLKEKIQFILLVMKIKISDQEKLDETPVKEWVIKNSSEQLYKKMFEPLIENKFGRENIDKISAAWLVSRIKLRSKTTAKGEILGYLDGGFKQLVDKLAEGIRKNGSDIINDEFLRFKIKDDVIEGAICNKKVIKADKYISTLPLEITFNKTRLPEEYAKRLKEIEYHGVFCLLLGLKKKISDIYWLNIIEDSPFKVIVEHTNFQDKEKYGTNLAYLAGYYPLSSEVWGKEKELADKFIDSLKKLFPNITDEDIVFKKMFSEKYAGIVSKRGFLKNLPKIETPFKNLSIIGMFNCYPERGLELQIRLVKDLIKETVVK